MKLIEFVGEDELVRIEHIFILTKKVERRINKGKLFYDKQIKRYIKRQIDLFFIGSSLEESAQNIYKHEMYNAVMYRLKPVFEEKNVLRAV